MAEQFGKKKGVLESAPAVAVEATSAFGLDAELRRQEPEDTVDFARRGEHIGVMIAGKYKLLEVIGEGGMGSVYRAQQTEPVKRAVAVKVIKAGMDSKGVLARFDAERQALAIMDHPNIAKVLDAGTTDSGSPFFVMELVKGVPITEFCDARKLTPRQRLELFVPVCQAIQHAHMKGIIHRDIKPSNVLVALYDDKPVPKVIDFGVAKATGASLTDQTMMTGLGTVVGTPEYMSPEQASFDQLDVDTRSDIYSLGVLLYELLTGSTPVDRKSLGKAALLEVLRVVREVEAPRPSAKLSTIEALPSVAANRSIEPAQLSKLMKGELDWILLKSLEKDRTRRYETANGFALDIQRYLTGEAVQAHPPSAMYQLKKFVRRNKGQVIAASLVLFALLVGMAGTTWGLIEARRQAQIARNETLEKENARKAEALRAEGERLAKQEAEAKGLEAKRQETEARRHEAEARRQEADAKRKLIRFRVATGTTAIERGEMWEALVWYAKAWQEDTDVQNEPSHRMRIASTLSQAPRLKAAFFHEMMVHDAQLSPDGTRLVSLTEDGIQVQLCDTATQAIVARLTPQTKTQAVAFSGDGKLLVTGSDDKTVRFWKAVDGTSAAAPLELDSPVWRLAAHPSLPVIAVSTEKSALILYDIEHQKQIAVTEPLDAKSAKSNAILRHVAFSADGSRVLAAAENQFRVWNSATGESISPLLDCRTMLNGDIRYKSCPRLSPDGTRAIGAAGEALAVIEVATGEVICPLAETKLGHVLQVAFSPNGQQLLTIHAHGPSALHVHDSNTGALLRKFMHPRSVLAAVWHPDGKRILSSSAGGEVHLWNAETAEELAPVNKHGISTSRLAFSADGQQALVADLDGTVRLWEYPPPTAPKPYDLAEGRDPWVGTASLDGRFMLMRPQLKGELILVSRVTGKPLGFPPFEIAEPVAARFSVDGERVLIVNAFGSGQVYDTATGRGSGPATKAIAENWVKCAAISPDGSRWAIGGTSSRAETYDTATGARLATVRHNFDVTALSFDATGQRLATASLDRNARVWDAKTGAPVSPQLNHPSSVYGASFSPDGLWLVTATNGKSIHLWDIRTGDPLGPPLTHPNNSKPWFDRDGQSIVFGNKPTAMGEAQYFRWKLPRFTAPAAEVPALAKLYSGRFVDDTDGLSTIDKYEFINNAQRYRQAWFASLGKEIPVVPMLPTSSATATAIDPDSIVPLAVALRSVGKTVTVEFTIESIGRTKTGGWVHLNSSDDYLAAGNFAAAIRNGATREDEYGLKQELVGRKIRATGAVSQYQGQTQIIIESKSQIEILPAAGAPQSPAKVSLPTREVVSLEVARKSIGKSVTVEFTVENVGRTKTGGWVYLNSKQDYLSEENLAVGIRNGATREEEFGLNQDLIGRKIRVSGTVAQHQGRSQIVVENKPQLEILPR